MRGPGGAARADEGPGGLGPPGFVRNQGNSDQTEPTADTRMTPQAFSHFTFEASHGELIVVDVQGVGDLFTDPQLHTAAITDDYSSSANLGVRGMAYFFASHKCNDICRCLNLTPVSTCPADSTVLSPVNTEGSAPAPPEAGCPPICPDGTLDEPAIPQLVRTKSARQRRHEAKSQGKGQLAKQCQLEVDCTKLDIYSMDAAQSVRVNPATIPDKVTPAGRIHLELAKMHCYGLLAQSREQRNMAAAMFHFRMAAQEGESEAVWNLSKMFQGLPGMLEELSTEENPAMAMALMKRAAQGGVTQALYAAAKCEEIEPENRAQFYEEAIKGGGGEFDWGNASYQLKAGLAALLIGDETSRIFDPLRSYDLFTEASEEAMDAGKMKLWERYSNDAEEKASPLCPE